MLRRGFTCQIQEMINEPVENDAPLCQRNRLNKNKGRSLIMPIKHQSVFPALGGYLYYRVHGMLCKEYKRVHINKCNSFAPSTVRSVWKILAQPLWSAAAVKTSCQRSCRKGCKWVGREYIICCHE